MEIGCLYYTSNELDGTPLNDWCKDTIKASQLPITSCSQVPIDFGNNIVYNEEGSVYGKRLGKAHSRLYRQILMGLKHAKEDYLFFVEHDVLYHPSHFDFRPKRDDTYYYDNNVVKYRLSDRKVVSYDCSWLSQLCANRELLINHYERRLKMIESGKKAYGFEPGTGQSKRIDKYSSERWNSDGLSIDVRHGDNFTGVKRMDPAEFRDKSNCQNFKVLEVSDLKGWDCERLLSL